MARGAAATERERLLVAAVPQLLTTHGFTKVSVSAHGSMKFVDAQAEDGGQVRFWLKQGWGNQVEFAAIQFGMLPKTTLKTDQEYEAQVDGLVASAKSHGARYLLMAHMPGEVIRSNYAVLEIDDVPLVYRRQLEGWPSRARNGSSPTLYFDDERKLPEAACVAVVRERTMALAGLAGLEPNVKGASQDSKLVWAETERRMKQEVFRLRVGKRCDWTCAVSGNRVRKVLEAAHLPGKNWRFNNAAADGIMLRADLHRLLDSGLAELRNGRFWIHEEARCDQYYEFHDRTYSL